MLSFLPLSCYFKSFSDLTLIIAFIITSLLNFFLHSKNKHSFAFYFSTICGYIYFICATLLYGLASNMHFYLLVMCMIAVVMFDNKIIIKSFIAFSIIAFFILKWFMAGKEGLVNFPIGMKSIQELLGHFILFLLFIITSIFFIFFKNDNLNSRKILLEQKDIIEEKNKDITASIRYAKRIQQTIMPSEKFIEKSIDRLKNKENS